jgi:hypothetical protein
VGEFAAMVDKPTNNENSPPNVNALRADVDRDMEELFAKYVRLLNHPKAGLPSADAIHPINQAKPGDNGGAHIFTAFAFTAPLARITPSEGPAPISPTKGAKAPLPRVLEARKALPGTAGIGSRITGIGGRVLPPVAVLFAAAEVKQGADELVGNINTLAELHNALKKGLITGEQFDAYVRDQHQKALDNSWPVWSYHLVRDAYLGVYHSIFGTGPSNSPRELRIEPPYNDRDPDEVEIVTSMRGRPYHEIVNALEDLRARKAAGLTDSERNRIGQWARSATDHDLFVMWAARRGYELQPGYTPRGRGEEIWMYPTVRDGRNVYGLHAQLELDGTLSLAITSDKDTSGRQMYDATMLAFGGNVKSILGGWVGGGDMADNYKTFVAALNAGLTAEQAAFATFAGKMAWRWGFTNVRIIQQSTSEDEQEVVVEFTR